MISSINSKKIKKEEFQVDLREMQESVENCGIYCPFQPSYFYNNIVDTSEKALTILNSMKNAIGNCRCLVDINKYIKKYEALS